MPAKGEAEAPFALALAVMGHIQAKAKAKREEKKNVKASRHLLDKSDKHVARLAAMELSELAKAFEEFADRSRKTDVANVTCMDLEEFKAALASLHETPLHVHAEYQAFAEELFSSFDLSHDGLLDISEFIAGMALVCKGTPEEKLRLSFCAYSSETGTAHEYITRADMYKMFKHAYLNLIRVLKDVYGQDIVEGGDEGDWMKHAVKAARETCEVAFAEIDVNGDNKISFSEFSAWALTNPTIKEALLVMDHGHSNDINVEVPVIFA